MRTTVDIDDPVLARAKRLAAKTGRSLGEVVSTALGSYLATPADEADEPFELLVRGKRGDRSPTPAEIAAVEDAEELARLEIARPARRGRK